PLPGAPATAGDPPAVARGLSLDLRLDPPNGRVGEPIAVTATLSGVGNVALWPEPVIGWPPGFRSYPGETATRIEARDGRIAPAPAPLSRIGRAERQFHALLASHVPDSEARDGDGLGRALRAAGVESAVADHVMRLRDRLRATRYGPRAPGDAAQLASELEQV